MHAYDIVCKKRYACATSNYREQIMQLQKKPRNLIPFQKLNLNTINIEVIIQSFRKEKISKQCYLDVSRTAEKTRKDNPL
jgi:hypothetical protein